jgi:hypothetical protein
LRSRSRPPGCRSSNMKHHHGLGVACIRMMMHRWANHQSALCAVDTASVPHLPALAISQPRYLRSSHDRHQLTHAVVPAEARSAWHAVSQRIPSEHAAHPSASTSWTRACTHHRATQGETSLTLRDHSTSATPPRWHRYLCLLPIPEVLQRDAACPCPTPSA